MHPIVLTGEGDVRAKRLTGKLDRVLVDAPCSGFGTLRRNPDLKSRQTEEGLAELNAKQSAILEAAAGQVARVRAHAHLLQEPVAQQPNNFANHLVDVQFDKL